MHSCSGRSGRRWPASSSRSRRSLFGWTEAAVRRLAEAGVVKRDRVDACAPRFRGLIVISTLDFLFKERPLGQDLASRQVHEVLHGFADGPALDGWEKHR